ncbi:hypothetical protein MGL_3241 [Malassezia globosa CBS 7966]|uniref:Mid2 domain-containing protein n=1 Tax=Malassezia globosa (strain ATCC MYA-4612 / CBS 7966) TaxID=425265 RepID=A8Q8B6_MALGO|nr:uncharacterized protein MGL_3241 [Malassezia globosa CBS 7966]EDP42483.1 hypothetical protein MGL_3241 [Malassezia globosa CBS 7966]
MRAALGVWAVLGCTSVGSIYALQQHSHALSEEVSAPTVSSEFPDPLHHHYHQYHHRHIRVYPHASSSVWRLRRLHQNANRDWWEPDNILAQGDSLLSSLVGGEFTTINKDSSAPGSSPTVHPNNHLLSSHEFTTINKNSRASPTDEASSSAASKVASQTSSSGDDEDKETSSQVPTKSSTSRSVASSTQTQEDSSTPGAVQSTSSTTMKRSSRSSSPTSSSLSSLSSSSLSSSSSTGNGDNVERTSATPSASSQESLASSQESSVRSPSSRASSAPMPTTSDADDESAKAQPSSSSGTPGSQSPMDPSQHMSNADSDGHDHTGLIAGVSTAGGVVVAALLLFMLYWLWKSRKSREEISYPDVTHDSAISSSPLPARQTGGAGFEMEHDRVYDDDVFSHARTIKPMDSFGDESMMQARSGGVPESYVNVPDEVSRPPSYEQQPSTALTQMAPVRHPPSLIPSGPPLEDVQPSLPPQVDSTVPAKSGTSQHVPISMPEAVTEEQGRHASATCSASTVPRINTLLSVSCIPTRLSSRTTMHPAPRELYHG